MTKIKTLRECANLTQSELASEIGVTQGCVAMWETGKAIPHSDKLPKLAQILGCSIDDLFCN